MSRVTKGLVALALLSAVVLYPQQAEAAKVYDQAFTGLVVLRTPDGGQVPYSWYVYFGPDTGGHCGGVAMIAGGVPIFGTHHDLGYYTVVLLDNPPYNSIFWVYKSGALLKVDSFSDSAGNTLSKRGTVLNPTQ